MLKHSLHALLATFVVAIPASTASVHAQFGDTQAAMMKWLVVLAALCVFWMVLRLRTHHLRARERQLSQLVEERTKQLLEREAELERANEALKVLSMTDSLTELANRRKLFEALPEAFEQARAQAQPLAVLMIDLDHFKDLNDAHGHLTGDACLRDFAACLRAELPPQALAARYGGEEFCILLPNTPLVDAAATADALRNCVASQRLPGCTATHVVGITMSVGVAACIPSASTSAEQLLARADAALYRAKAAGRNRVVCDDACAPHATQPPYGSVFQPCGADGLE